MIEYRTTTFAKRDHKAKSCEWDEWHVSGDKIRRCLLDQEGLVLPTETLEGDVAAALVALATTGSDLTTHDADMARKLEQLHRRQTQQLLRAMRKSMA
jgi:hypothetical protein